MLLATTAVIAGLILLVVSADRFVAGASGLAYNLGVSPLMIGLTIVAFGTSAPEIFVSAAAALQGNTNLAIGNAIGSNIANVGLVLGITALIVPVYVHAEVIQRQFPIMFGVMIIAVIILFNLELGRFEALILVLVLFAFIFYTVMNERKQTPMVDELDSDIEVSSTAVSIAWLLIGLAVLVFSSKILVWGAVEIARAFGVSDLIIGLTIIAIGTSLPEVATSVTSALKGKSDLAIGNVVGSNIFNLLAVVGTAGLINPTSINNQIISRDLPVMFIITLLMLVFVTPWRDERVLTRAGGFILLIGYLAYLLFLIIQALNP